MRRITWYHAQPIGASIVALISLVATTANAQRADTTRADSTRVGRVAAVITTATHTPKSTFSAPAPVEVLTNAAIRDRAPNSAADLFRDLPGLDVNGVGTNQTRPTIRGLLGQRILLLEDGIRLNNSRRQQDFGEIPSLVSVGDLDRIEVVRGASSVLYGSDAIGGVINLITRDDPATESRYPHGAATVFYSSADKQRKGMITAAQRVGSFAVRLSGTRRDADPYDAPAGSFGAVTFANRARVEDSGVHDASYVGSLSYGLSASHTLSAKYERYEASDNGFGFVDPQLLGEFEPLIRITYPDQGVDRLTLRYRGSALGSRLADKLDVTMYTASNERQLALDIFVPFGPGTPPGAGVISQSANFTDIGTIGGRVEATKILARHQVIYGVDVFRDRSDNTDSSTTTIVGFGPPQTTTSLVPQVPNASMTSLGAFLQDEFQVIGPLTLVAGVRAQKNDADTRRTPRITAPTLSASNGTVVGSVNALYELADGLVLIGSAGRAFRSPNLVERFFDGPTPEGSGFQRSNPELNPETSINIDLGARLRRGRVSAEAFAFRNQVRDGIRIAATGDSVNQLPVFSNVNVDRLRYTGFEAQASVLVAGAWQVSANHSRLTSRNERDPLNAIGASYSAKTVGSLSYDDPRGRFWGSYLVRHNGEVKDDQIEGSVVGDVLPPFTVQTLRAGLRVFTHSTNRGTLVLAVENLGNALYAESANTSFFRPAPRRNFVASLAIDF